MPPHQRPVGTVTRGTTNPNRLRRCDRWIAGPQAWRLRRSPASPVVVDLGYGASPTTAVELHDRIGVKKDIDRLEKAVTAAIKAAGKLPAGDSARGAASTEDPAAAAEASAGSA